MSKGTILTMKEPCPYCGSPFGRTSEFMSGCMNADCPEFPRIHDPVGNPEIVDAFWENIQSSADMVKSLKRAQLNLFKETVDKYYK